MNKPELEQHVNMKGCGDTMWNRINKKLKEKKGFTLLEMISVIAVIAIIGTIVTVGVNTFMVSSYMIKANQTAKTVFLAAQNYITQQKEIGALGEFNENIAKHKVTEFNMDSMLEILTKNKAGGNLDDWKINHQTSKFVSTYVNSDNRENITDKNDPAYNAFYAEIIEPNIKDENITDHCFLLEYDATTGVVIGVFYSEKIKQFSSGNDPIVNPYALNPDQVKTNVIARDSDSLKNKRQGYYGVNMSNYASNTVAMEAPIVKLVNSDQLYLEWQDMNIPVEGVAGREGNPEFLADGSLKDKLYYEVLIKPAGKSITIRKSDVTGHWIVAENADDLESSWIVAEKAEDVKPNSPIFTYDSVTNTYALLLDCVDYSILQMYPGVYATDMITCTVTAKLDTPTSGGDTTSNVESANFGGGEGKITVNNVEIDYGGSGNKSENGKSKDIVDNKVVDNSYTVKNARHLNNMRNVKPESDFTQTDNIDWNVPGHDEMLFKPLEFLTVLPTNKPNYSPGSYNEVYKGIYKVNTEDDTTNNYFHISNLKIYDESKDYGANIGMFSSNAGIIQGVTLLNANVTGVEKVGAVVGTNMPDGILSDIRVDAQVSCPTLELDKNTSFSAEKTAGTNIGGIIGLNEGTAKNLTTLINSSDEQNIVKGVSNVGGIIGKNNSSKEVKTLTNNNNVNMVLSQDKNVANNNFGGLVGENTEKGEIESSKNAGLISLNIVKKSNTVVHPSNIGGIAGTNNGILKSCKSELSKENPTSYEELLKNYLNELNKAESKLPEYAGINVGGIAGVNGEEEENSALIEDCSVDNAVLGRNIVGGLVGVNMGKVTSNIASSGVTDPTTGTKVNVNGLVIGSGNMVGGIFGYSSSNIQNYKNSANVFGASMVGGITGVNGVAFNNIQDLVKVDWDSKIDEAGSKNKEDYEKLRTADITDTERAAIEARIQSYYELLMAGIPSDQGITTKNDNSLSKCDNLGFVYASKRYSGGIAGVNLGKIESCNSSYTQKENDPINSNYHFLTNADCAGGIAGLNKGTIKGDNKNIQNIVYGNSFVGGVVGWNVSSLSGYRDVSGSILGKENYVGGYLGMNSDINSINTTDITFTGNAGSIITGRNYVGGIIGGNVVAAKEGTADVNITADTSNALAIQGEAFVGGIIGYHSAVGELNAVPQRCAVLTVKNPYVKFDVNEIQSGTDTKVITTYFESCVNMASVVGTRYVGGIIGFNENGSSLFVNNCNNMGNISIVQKGYQIPEDAETEDGVSGTSYFIGGITGRNTSDGIIARSYNSGNVSSPSKYLGGLCEVNEGVIRNCHIGDATNIKFKIEGKLSVGGIVGLNHTPDPSKKPATVQNCTANEYASISGGSNTGGLVGTNQAIIKDCTTAANVSAPEGDKVGGIVGFNGGSISATSIGSNKVTPLVTGRNNVGGLIGVNSGTILQTGTVTENGTQKTLSNLTNWADVTGQNNVGGIVGSHNSDIIINCKNYGTIKSNVNEEGIHGYAGGITGVNEANKTIEDCENYGSVTSDYSKAGGIVGLNAGTIKSSDNLMGTVSSKNAQAGGIAGVNEGIISQSTNQASVSGAIAGKEGDEQDTIGGIAGKNSITGSIKDCISKLNTESTNSITGSNLVGGIVGWNQGNVKMSNDIQVEKNVNININVKQPTNSAGTNQLAAAYIGGIIGKDDYVANGVKEKELSNYTYSGAINIADDASQRQYIGGIIGYLDTKHSLKNCEFNGVIMGMGNKLLYKLNSQNKPELIVDGGVGGMTGYSKGNIYLNVTTGSSNAFGISSSGNTNSAVSGLLNVGGIVGYRDSGSLLYNNTGLNSSTTPYILNEINVNGDTNIGGLIGYTKTYKAEDLKNKGTINGKMNVGGIIGQQAGGSLTNCINLPEGVILVTQQENSNIGGIVGYSSPMEFRSCKNLGKITDSGENTKITVANVGGIAGQSLDSIFITCSNGESNVKQSQLNKSELQGSINFKCNVTGVGGIVGNYRGKPSPTKDKFPTTAAMLGQLVDEFLECNNYGNITMDSTSSKSVGGIIGMGGQSAKDRYLKISDCNNYGTIKMMGRTTIGENDPSGGIGGILGEMNTFLCMIDSDNYGKIEGGNYTKVGGIVGISKGFNSSYYKGFIKSCNNNGNASVDGGSNVGGIIGRLESAEYFTIDSCTNSGVVAGVQETGGILGNHYNNVSSMINSGSFKLCNNNGTVKIQLSSDKSRSPARIGGCIGTSTSTGELYSGLINNGQIIADESVKDATDVGGIVGSLKTSNTIKDCVNNAVIDLSNIKVTNFGGIIGSAVKDAQIDNCRNANSIIASADSKYVGGIAGYFENSTMSGCKSERLNATENEEGKSPIIRGGNGVGGLVGTVKGVNTKILSDVKQKESEEKANIFNGSYNTFDVSAVSKAGGIAGELSGSALISLYNSGKVSVKWQENPTSADVSAGGIVGHSKKDDAILNQGVIINCYNLGEVGWNDAPSNPNLNQDKVTGFIGGIIGYRDRGVTSTGDARNTICQGAVIQDCYYISDKIVKTLPLLTLGKDSVTQDSWIVGNEPFNNFTTPQGDSQSSPFEKDKKGVWSKGVFEKMLEVVQKEGNYNSDKELDNIKIILENYFYKLPVPETLPITGVCGTTYEMKWKGLLGLTDGFEISIYTAQKEDKEIGNMIGDGKKIWSSHYDKNNVEKLTFDLSAIANEYMGKTIYLSVKALGYGVGTGSDKLMITTDSDDVVIQSFVMMPPLPTVPLVKDPAKNINTELEISQVNDEKKVTLTLNGIIEYFSGNPLDDYHSLVGVAEPLLITGLYDAYKNGIAKITVIDYKMNTENGTLEEWHKKKEEMQIDWEKNEATLVFDYSNDKDTLDGRYWHAYVCQVEISDTQKEASLQPPNVKYRYLSSDTVEKRYLLKTTQSLTKPNELASTFIGTTTAASYELIWKHPIKKEEVVTGYRVTVKNPDTNKEIASDILEKNVYSYSLTEAQIKSLMEGTNYPAYNETNPVLEWTVTAIGGQSSDNKTTYTDSISEKAQITLPLNQKAVESVTGEILDFYFESNIVEFSWADVAYIPQSTSYKLSAVVEADGAIVPPAQDVGTITNISGNSCRVNLPVALDKDYKVTLNIVKEGEYGKSFDSVAAVGSKEVKKRLPSVKNLTSTNPKIDETDTSMVKVTLSWDPITDEQDKCAGYLFAVLPEGVTDMSMSQQYKVENVGESSFELKFDIATSLETDFLVYAYAMGIEGSSSTSMYSKSQLISLPKDRLTAPQNVELEIKNSTGDLITDACIKKDFAGLSYNFTWSNNKSELERIKGTKFILKDEDGINVLSGDGIVLDSDAIKENESYSMNLDLMAYAGKELKLTMINLSGSKQYLTSVATVTTIQVPNIKLDKPVVNSVVTKLDGEEIVPGRTYTLEEIGRMSYDLAWTNPPEDEGDIVGHEIRVMDGIDMIFSKRIENVEGALNNYQLIAGDFAEVEWSDYEGDTLQINILNLNKEDTCNSDAGIIDVNIPGITLETEANVVQESIQQAESYYESVSESTASESLTNESAASEPMTQGY